MRSDMESITLVAGRSLVSIVCCVILGFPFYQWSLFNPHFSSFIIVDLGVIGSLFFFTMRVNRRNSLALLVVLFVIDTGLIAHSIQFRFFLRDFVFVALEAAALYGYFAYFDRAASKLRALYPLVLATSLLIALVAATLLMELVSGTLTRMTADQFLRTVQFNATNGFIIGLGIGLGILLIDRGYLQAIVDLTKRSRRALGGAFTDFFQHS